MGCPCQNKVSFNTTTFAASKEVECGYSQEIIYGWKNILECIKNAQTYDEIGLSLYDVNVFLGNILSALNNDICSFTKQLDQIQPYILNAVNLNICQA